MRAALGFLVVALVVAGCERKAVEQDVSGLEITRYRLNVDDVHRVARVIVEVRNSGDKAVKEAVVVATLQGRADEEFASGQTTVQDIAPGEAKVASILIDAKGIERDVEFSILSPEQAMPAADTGVKESE